MYRSPLIWFMLRVVHICGSCNFVTTLTLLYMWYHLLCVWLSRGGQLLWISWRFLHWIVSCTICIALSKLHSAYNWARLLITYLWSSVLILIYI